MNKMIRKELKSHYVLFSIEGGCEAVVINKLVQFDLLVTPEDLIVKDRETFKPYTRKRKAIDIANMYMDQSYETNDSDQLLVARIVDSETPAFNMPKPYKNSVIIRSFITSPEIEMLAIHNENAYKNWSSWFRKTKKKPSEFCKQELGLKHIKQPKFLDSYWNDPDKLTHAIQEYAEKAKTPNKAGFFMLRDLLK